jgi:uncharacterized heparinase superfamily protein
MRHRLGQSVLHIQFGKITSDGDGDAGVILDTVPPTINNASVILSPKACADTAAFELGVDTFHVTVSTQVVTDINYIAVSAE